MEKAIKRYWPVFLLPTLAAFVIGFIIPFIQGVYLSFCQFTTVRDASFIGFSNFTRALADTTFTFSFAFPTLRERISDHFRKNTFARLLPETLRHCGETAESAGEKLDIEPRFWKRIVKGTLYPEKNTVLALALVCGMQWQDVLNLLAVCGFEFRGDEVRDVVVRYLIENRIFNERMRDDCLAEYSVTNLPIRRTGESA